MSSRECHRQSPSNAIDSSICTEEEAEALSRAGLPKFRLGEKAKVGPGSRGGGGESSGGSRIESGSGP